MSLKLTAYAASTALAACICLGSAPALAQALSDQKMDRGSNKMMKSGDAKFAMAAARGGIAEIQLGQLAAQKAGSADVKAFGRQMADDHSKANDDLKSVAAKEGMTLPDALDGKDQALESRLQNLSGEEFDHAYVKAMVKDHEEDIKEFQKEASMGKDPQIKDFASRTLPVLQMHLEKIKSIESGMAGK